MDSCVGFFITVTKEKEGFLQIPRVQLVSPTLNKEYCPVRAVLLWIYTRGLFLNQKDISFEEFFKNEQFEIKEEVKDCPLWCNIKQGTILQTSGMLSRNFGKRITKLSIQTGFPKGSVSGHSMRKGCATAWMLNIVRKTGTYSTQDWHDLEDHIGWGVNSKHTKLYVDQSIKLMRDTTNMITAEKETSYIINEKEIEKISPPPNIPIKNNTKKLPQDLIETIHNYYRSSAKIHQSFKKKDLTKIKKITTYLQS